MLSALSIMGWKDIVEILFFATVIYGFSRWLMHDATKKMAPYLYLYIFTIIGAQALSLTTVSLMLLISAPGIIGLFILMHQHTLQKNLISLKNITTAAAHTSHDWVETLTQLILQQLTSKKDVVCIIEKNDSLEPFIDAAFMLHTPVSSDTMNLIFASPSYQTQEIIWIKRNGTVVGINGNWKELRHTTNQELYEATIVHTQYNDALFFHSQAHHNRCSVIKKGLVHNDIDVAHVRQLIRQHVYIADKKNQGVVHEPRTKSTLSQKPSA